MTDRERAIRRWVETHPGDSDEAWLFSKLTSARKKTDALRLEALKAIQDKATLVNQLAVAKKLIERLAPEQGVMKEDMNGTYCVWCSEDGWHSADCPWVAARAALAAGERKSKPA